jgi:hypothetical protein
VPVDDVPDVPDPAMSGGLLGLHEVVTEEHLDGAAGHLAMALCRPGHPAITADDDEWADAMHVLLDDGRIDGTWSLHLAAGNRVVELTRSLP